MKIKVKNKSYDQVIALPPQKHKKPMKQTFLFRLLLYVVSLPDLIATRFRGRKIGMERIGKKEPCLVLMNHSSFVDLEIVTKMMFSRRYAIVATSDGFVGKNLLMRLLGCIPTNKFVFDLTLIRDMKYAAEKLNSSIVLYPEASYSFDGRATPLPETIGQCVKLLGLPLVMIKTDGAFARQPLYNNLIRRPVRVTADMTCLLTKEEVKAASADEINALLAEQFSFDAFRSQYESKLCIDHPRRAEELHRVLYKCPVCRAEGKLVGAGADITCQACGQKWHLSEYGKLEGEGGFEFVPDWYAWEREEVKREIIDGSYSLDCEVEICMGVDTKCIYRVGEGRLIHNAEGFRLTGCDGKLEYSQKTVASYSLYADYYWYELGDMICIGNQKVLYYCFPKDKGIPVAKARLAAEELYQLHKKARVR